MKAYFDDDAVAIVVLGALGVWFLVVTAAVLICR